jgi:hypothetical protein
VGGEGGVVRLIRDDQNDVRTLGAMFDVEERICETLELPWRDNQRGISCIPEGSYECKLGFSPSRKYDVYWLQNVIGRQDVQIHIGNFTKDIRGCILLGTTRNKNSIGASRVAFDKFMARMDGKPFTLTVEKAA